MAHGHGVDGIPFAASSGKTCMSHTHTHSKHISEVTGVNDYGPFTSISDDLLSSLGAYGAQRGWTTRLCLGLACWRCSDAPQDSYNDPHLAHKGSWWECQKGFNSYDLTNSLLLLIVNIWYVAAYDYPWEIVGLCKYLRHACGSVRLNGVDLEDSLTRLCLHLVLIYLLLELC